MNPVTHKPWYREPWPWLLMIGPVTVIIAGIVTYYLAVISWDGLVDDDYYKQGLGINRQLARDQAARTHGVSAHATFSDDLRQVRMVLRHPPSEAPPPELTLKLTHSTRSGIDQRITLANSNGIYQGTITPPAAGRWLLTLENPTRQWRIVGTWQVPGNASVELSPAH